MGFTGYFSSKIYVGCLFIYVDYVCKSVCVTTDYRQLVEWNCTVLLPFSFQVFFKRLNLLNLIFFFHLKS